MRTTATACAAMSGLCSDGSPKLRDPRVDDAAIARPTADLREFAALRPRTAERVVLSSQK